MSRKSLGVALGFLVVLVAAVSFYRLEKSTRPPEVPGSGPVVPAVRPADAQPGSAPVRLPEGGAPGAGLTGELAPSAAAESADTAATALPTVGDILAEPGDDFLPIAKKLAALVINPRVAMEEREEALAHTLNLSANHEAEVLTPLVTDANLPDPFAETILADALNRPLSYQADLYLAALPVRKSPEMQTMIREHLAFLTGGEDRGPNPADWAADIRAAKAEWKEE